MRLQSQRLPYSQFVRHVHRNWSNNRGAAPFTPKHFGAIRCPKDAAKCHKKIFSEAKVADAMGNYFFVFFFTDPILSSLKRHPTSFSLVEWPNEIFDWPPDEKRNFLEPRRNSKTKFWSIPTKFKNEICSHGKVNKNNVFSIHFEQKSLNTWVGVKEWERYKVAGRRVKKNLANAWEVLPI